ncbi:hypothetical protein GM3709_1251 [Geminocystis sp. NIES-3709]|nr:hypothetical protein GM3709_1251 [Geminocystis sp. NIES-3709]
MPLSDSTTIFFPVVVSLSIALPMSDSPHPTNKNVLRVFATL